MWPPPSQPDDRAVEQLGDLLNNVGIRHRDTQDRCAWFRWCAAEKSPLTLEDSNEPVELKLIYDAYEWAKTASCQWDCFAGRLSGFEPLLGGPQPLVLPLHHSRRGSNATAFALSLSD